MRTFNESTIVDKYSDGAYHTLTELVERIKIDHDKLVTGNRSAGTRVRGRLQLLKSLANQMRVEVQAYKNNELSKA